MLPAFLGKSDATRCCSSAPLCMQFPMPGANWYSYGYGPIHFTAWDTELEYGAGSPQYDFVLSDLQGVNRSVTVRALGCAAVRCMVLLSEQAALMAPAKVHSETCGCAALAGVILPQVRELMSASRSALLQHAPCSS